MRPTAWSVSIHLAFLKRTKAHGRRPEAWTAIPAHESKAQATIGQSAALRNVFIRVHLETQPRRF